jgi:hypothetical protein
MRHIEFVSVGFFDNLFFTQALYAASTPAVLATLKRHKCRPPVQGRKARQNVGGFSPRSDSSEIRLTGGMLLCLFRFEPVGIRCLITVEMFVRSQSTMIDYGFQEE